MDKQTRPALFSLILFGLSFHILGAIAPAETVARWFLTDDAHFYFVVARNIVAGHGITFDGFGLSSGFHPLWMLVILPVFAAAQSDPILPLRLLIVLMGLLNAGTTYLVYRLLNRAIAPPLALAGAALWAFTPAIHAISARNGLESPLSAFLLAALLFAVTRLDDAEAPPLRHVLLVGLLGGLTFLARLDNIFEVVLLGLWLVTRRLPLRGLLFADLLAFYLAASLSLMLRLGLGDTFYQYARGIFYLFLCATAVRVPLYFFLGLYHQVDFTSPAWLKRAGLAALLGGALTSALMLALTAVGLGHGLPRIALLYEAVLSAAALFLTRGLAHGLGLLSLHLPPPLRWLRANWRGMFRDAAATLGVLAVFLGAYLVWSMLTYGTPTPLSGQIKEWWGTLPDTAYGDPAREPLTFFGINPEDAKGPWALATGALFALQPMRALPAVLLTWLAWAVVGFYLLKRHADMLPRLAAQGLLPLFAGGMFQYWTYTTRAYVGMRTWYWTAELLFTTLAAAVLLDMLLRFIKDPLYRQSAQTIASIGVALGLALFFGLSTSGLIRQNIAPGEQGWHLAHVRALEAHTARRRDWHDRRR
ncbi:MAG: glycosyltransferase family 39 protein [Anaerolineales bacterium]